MVVGWMRMQRKGAKFEMKLDEMQICSGLCEAGVKRRDLVGETDV
jgi:hypothetical protein